MQFLWNCFKEHDKEPCWLFVNLCQCWSMSPCGITEGQWVNSLSPWEMCNIPIDYSDCCLNHLLSNCFRVDVKIFQWWPVNIGSGVPTMVDFLIGHYTHRMFPPAIDIIPTLSLLTLLMLETEYSGLFDQYDACWCPGDLSRQGINRHGIDKIG